VAARRPRRTLARRPADRDPLRLDRRHHLPRNRLATLGQLRRDDRRLRDLPPVRLRDVLGVRLPRHRHQGSRISAGDGHRDPLPACLRLQCDRSNQGHADHPARHYRVAITPRLPDCARATPRSPRPAALRLAGRIRSRATLNRPQPPELGEEPPRVHRVRRAQDDLTVCLAHDVPSVTQAGARPPSGQVQVDAPTAPEGHLALALAGRAGARVPLAHSGRRQRSWRPTPAPPRVSAHRLPRTRR
jgi:hypothetical protein